MENRPDHPEVLSDFESAPPRRVRRWAWAAMGLGLLLLAIRLLIRREDAAIPALFAVAASMLMGFVPALNAPDVWMQALPLAVLAGTGTAKAARGNGR